ncbi:GNAT family N-acetyltransferase [Maribacter algicola]|uniref:GNAT family N-acetyltransferase n=1 Tax=Meishania litoralis TaxID=3434685 RepID=A0ACC7LLH8_9FLAO
MDIKIIPFEPKYAGRFKDLNQAWLEKFFFVEPKDVLLLRDCENSIIDKGGYIFFAEHEKSIIGCFSFIKIENDVFELGKMAVDENYQGMKIGQHLLTFAIDFAKKGGWKKIILYSSTKLDAALHIYRKYGFTEIPLEKENPYVRSDIKMELLLN